MKTNTIELPDDLRLSGPETTLESDLAREVRLAVAVEWYRRGGSPSARVPRAPA
jgi:hypothetical protein